MASVCIVYGSTTGNTTEVAEMIEKGLSQAGHTVTSQEVSGAQAKGLCEKYDAVLFGCSTWGDDDIEMQDDFVPFFDSFEELGANGKKVGAFGCGDSSYTYFCGAVDAIEKRLEELGGEVFVGGLRIDGDPSSAEGEITDWIAEVARDI